MPEKKDFITRSAELPAEVLQATIDATETAGKAISNGKALKRSKDYWRILGPGLTTGASDDDPAGVATYSQTGAQYGFQLLWLAPLTFPLMAIVQEMCARIGIVTGRGLAGNIRTHFSKKVLYVCTLLLFAANTFNIGADLGAMAKGVQLLYPHVSFAFLVVAFSILTVGLQIFTPYAKYAKYLKWLAMILLAYVLSAFLAHPDWGNVLRNSVVPSITFSKDQLLLVCAILGTTISPYLFFWQTSQEVEEQILKGKTSLELRKGASKQDIKSMRIDVWSGMFLSNLVMFFIIAACGGVLFAHGITNIGTASDAAQALKPFAGDYTYLLFAVGIIGTGLLAIPVLAGSSSYALAESFKWREGLYRKLKQAQAFYGTIIISMIVGLAMNFIGLDPIKALIYSAVGNGLVAPVVLFLIVRLSSSKKVMGEWVNRPTTTAFGWVVVIMMAVSGAGAIYSLFP